LQYNCPLESSQDASPRSRLQHSQRITRWPTMIAGLLPGLSSPNHTPARFPHFGSFRSLRIRRLLQPQRWTINEIPSTPGRGMKTPTSPTTPSPRSPPLPPAVGARSRVRVRGCTAARTFPLPPENVHGTGACRAPGRHPPSHGQQPADQCAARRPGSGDGAPWTRRARSAKQKEKASIS